MDEKKELKDEEISEVSGGKGIVESLREKMGKLLEKIGVKKPKPMVVAYGGPRLELIKHQEDVLKSAKSAKPDSEE